MSTDATKVTAGKPMVGGAVHWAPSGTTLPTNATAALAAAFVDMGYISEDGVTNSNERETEDIKAWGGDTVLVLDNGKTETYQFTLLDATSILSLKLMHGESNVTGTSLASGISVKSNNSEKEKHAFVVDMIEAENTLHRIVIPKGVVTEIGDITYVDNEPIRGNVTITALADDNGNTAYEYFKTA